MNSYLIREDKGKEADLIVEKIVEYNLSKIPLKQDVPFLWINRVVENKKGE